MKHIGARVARIVIGETDRCGVGAGVIGEGNRLLNQVRGDGVAAPISQKVGA